MRQRLQLPLSLRFLGDFSWLVGQDPRPSVPKVVLDDVQVIDQYSCFRTSLFIVFMLCLGLLDWLGLSFNSLSCVMGSWVDEFVLRYTNVRHYGFLSMMVQATYVSEDDAALLEDLGLVVIVDVETRE
jgi:hypothetical protein